MECFNYQHFANSIFRKDFYFYINKNKILNFRGTKKGLIWQKVPEGY